MSQLTNFIPKTTAECRSLLETLNGHTAGMLTLTDRYGHTEDFSPKESRSLAELITAHIGYEAPKPAEAPAVPEETKEAPAEKKPAPAKKSNTKSAAKK